MTATVAAQAPLSEENISARVERLPVSGWYRRIMLIVGTAGFFDAFDALTIAFVLPVLIGMWHITPPQIGALISIGYLGQLIGAIGFSWLAERHGYDPAAEAARLIEGAVDRAFASGLRPCEFGGPHGTAALQGGPLTVTLVNGVATFSGLKYNVAETMNLVFTTNASGVASATSGDIVVSPAAASQLVVTTQPSATARFRVRPTVPTSGLL